MRFKTENKTPSSPSIRVVMEIIPRPFHALGNHFSTGV